MRSRRPIDFAWLRGQITPERVLRLAGWRPVWSQGVLHRGPCPIHGSRDSGSRILSVTDRVVYCHKCKWTGDAIAIWSRLKGLDALDAAMELCAELHIDPPYLTRR